MCEEHYGFLQFLQKYIQEKSDKCDLRILNQTEIIQKKISLVKFDLCIKDTKENEYSCFYIEKMNLIGLFIYYQKEFTLFLKLMNRIFTNSNFFINSFNPKRIEIWNFLKENDNINELKIYTENGIKDSEENESYFSNLTDITKYPLYSALISLDLKSRKCPVYFYGNSISIPDYCEDQLYAIIEKFSVIFEGID